MIKHCACVGLFAAAVAAPAMAGGDGDGATFEIGASFYAPSHNIYCNYYDAGGEEGTAFHDQGSEIHCALLKPKPTVVVLTGQGKMTITHPSNTNMETTFADRENVLAYGKTSKSGIHVCLSTPEGMQCTVKGKGFVLSKKGVKTIR